jgi:hypothetical protein
MGSHSQNNVLLHQFIHIPVVALPAWLLAPVRHFTPTLLTQFQARNDMFVQTDRRLLTLKLPQLRLMPNRQTRMDRHLPTPPYPRGPEAQKMRASQGGARGYEMSNYPRVSNPQLLV